MKPVEDPIMLSLLVSKNDSKNHEVTLGDIIYKNLPEVTKCQRKIYSLVISMLNAGKSYDEIIDAVNKIDIPEYQRLEKDERIYVKMKVKKDINSRKNNENKKGEMMYNE